MITWLFVAGVLEEPGDFIDAYGAALLPVVVLFIIASLKFPSLWRCVLMQATLPRARCSTCPHSRLRRPPLAPLDRRLALQAASCQSLIRGMRGKGASTAIDGLLRGAVDMT